MAKIKKTFDRESMYKKIMPTNLKRDEQPQQKEANLSTIVVDNSSKEMSGFQKNDDILYNITEKLVLNKLDAILKKMNCCRCDRCKEDIIAIALNNLKPMYIVANKEIFNRKINEMQDASTDITTELIKAVLVVRKSPRH